jgi:hypothetical protein
VAVDINGVRKGESKKQANKAPEHGFFCESRIVSKICIGLVPTWFRLLLIALGVGWIPTKTYCFVFSCLKV